LIHFEEVGKVRLAAGEDWTRMVSIFWRTRLSLDDPVLSANSNSRPEEEIMNIRMNERIY
jgi:hypothetical protein